MGEGVGGVRGKKEGIFFFKGQCDTAWPSRRGLHTSSSPTRGPVFTAVSSLQRSTPQPPLPSVPVQHFLCGGLHRLTQTRGLWIQCVTKRVPPCVNNTRTQRRVQTNFTPAV